ncbi:unnamed protein product [Paramecium primaurelia]|uniref:B box-type domain-containing protein n=1 Tax=Paramecium primaurelia TaxID=5886 RepID=A0A8S1P9I7_PARPR|nr:unnamed protein product [Paramecium primaurelia]
MNSSQRQPRSRIFDVDSQRPSDRSNTPTRALSPLQPSQHIQPQQQQQQQQQPQQPIPTFQPQKLKHILYNAQQSTPIVSCHYHPDQYIQNFCKNPDCLLPLCPMCVTIHQDDHLGQDYAPHFDLLSYCLGEQYNKIVDICNLLGEDIEDVVELKNLVKNHREVQKKKFLEAKEQFYKAIDTFMQNLENNLNSQSIKQTDQLLNEINQFHRLSYDRWNNMQGRLQKLNSEKCLKTLIKSYRQSRPEDVYQRQHEMTITFVDQVKNELDQVEIRPSQLQIILDQLQSYIFITRDQIKQPKQVSPIKPQQQQQQQQIIRRVVHERPNSQQNHYNSSSPIPTRVLQGFPILQKFNPITAIETMTMPQLPPLPSGFPSIMPFQNQQFNFQPQYAQSMMLPNQQFLSQQIHPMPFPQQHPYPNPPQLLKQQQLQQPIQQFIQPAQQQAAPPVQQQNQPLAQINLNQQEKPGEVIDLKTNKQPLKMAEQFHNQLFNSGD